VNLNICATQNRIWQRYYRIKTKIPTSFKADGKRQRKSEGWRKAEMRAKNPQDSRISNNRIADF